MDTNRARLATFLDERRLELRLRWNDVSQLAGVTRETLRQVRQGEGNIRELTKRGIETALQWAPGSIDAILQGGKPSLVTPAGGFATRSDFPPLGTEGQRGGGTELSTGRRLPSWFASEVSRRGLAPESLTAAVDQLRVLASHFGYTIGDLLLNVGFATEDDLKINERPASQGRALADFDEAMSRIASSRYLSKRQQREIRAFAEEGRARILRGEPEEA